MPCSFNILYNARPLKSQYFVFLFNCVNGENVASPLSLSLSHSLCMCGRRGESLWVCFEMPSNQNLHQTIRLCTHSIALINDLMLAPHHLFSTEPNRNEASWVNSSRRSFRFLPARQVFCSRPPFCAHNDINKSKILLSQRLLMFFVICFEIYKTA